MRVFLSSIVVSFALLIAAPALPQEGDPPTLALGYTIEVKSGHEAEFEAAMKKQMDWYRKNDETWTWNTWRIQTGERSGQYVLRSPGHHWKDMDDRAERADRARAHFLEVAGSHIESLHGMVSAFMPSLSNWPDDPGQPPMISVYELNVHYGMGEEFVRSVAKIHAAILESDWPLNYGWVTTVNGGEMPTFWLILPHDSWQEMQGPDRPLWEMVEEKLGRADSDALRASVTKCVRRQTVSLAHFQPDLSYSPTGE